MLFGRIGSYSVSAVVAFGLLASGCGGGGDSSTTTANPPTTTSTSTSVTGTVVSTSTSGSTGSASVGKSGIDRGAELLVSGALVNIASFDKSDVKLSDINITTRDEGVFNTKIEMAQRGGYLLVTVRKDGLSEFTKRIDYDSLGNVDFKAVLDEMASTVAKVPETGDISLSRAVVKASNGVDYVQFALFKDQKTGKSQVVVGKEVQRRKSAGSVAALDIMIPVQGLRDANVTALKADLKSYNPANPDEESRFPGRYMDSKGNRLVSLGFDAINIETDKGENLGALTKRLIKAGKLKKSAAAGSTITRHISSDNCSILSNGDVNNSVPGFQLPIYTYNRYKNDNAGAWDFLGVGTIVDSDGTTITTIGTDASSHCAANSGEYIKIDITNEDFLKYWWNLDYPLASKNPDRCVEGDFLINGKKVNKSFNLTLRDDDTATGFTTQNKYAPSGHYKIETFSSDPDDTTGTLSYYDFDDYSIVDENVTLGTNGNCSTHNINIKSKPTCRVNGKILKDDNTPAAGVYVSAYSSNPYSWRGGYTDSAGNYSFEVKCGVEQEFYINNKKSAYSILPNGSVDPNEISDTALADSNGGFDVNVSTVTLPDNTPYAYGYLSTRSMKTSGNAILWIYGYDADSVDNPVNFTLKIGNAKTISGNGSSDGLYASYNLADFNLSEGTYPITLEVSGKSHPSNKATVNIGSLEIVSVNRKPTIQYAYASNNEGSINTPIALRAKGYDLDGDNLSASWKEGGATVCTDSTGSGSVQHTCSYSPTSTGTKTLTFSLSDGVNTVDKNITLNIVNHAPVIAQAYASKYRTEVGEDVNLTAAVYDIDGDTVNAKLYANDEAIAKCEFSGEGSAADPLSRTCTYTMPSTPSTVTFRLEVSDGSKTRHSTFSVIGGTSADAVIKIQ